MERALATTPALVPEHRIMAQFDLAKFWSQQGVADRAFGFWVEGHRLLGKFQPFSREAHRGFIDASMNCLDRTRLHAGPRAQNRDPAPVFIVGMPRSGTTLAEQILAARPAAFGAGERPALGQTWQALGGGERREAVALIAALDQSALDRAAAS
jgi:Sulfotransferase family